MRARRARPLWAACLALAVLTSACSSPRPTPPTPSSQPPPRLRVLVASFQLGAPVQREVALIARDTIYLLGGLGPLGQSLDTVSTLNPATGKERQVGTVSQAFHDAAGAVIGGRLVIFGGGSGESSDLIQAFDLATHRTTIIARLPRPLSDLAATVSGSAVYVVGGFNGRVAQSTIYSTTDGVAFRTAGKLPVGLRYPAVATAGGQIVIAGGVSTPGGAVSTVYVFDPADGTVSTLGKLPVRIGHAMAFTIGSTVYVAGGLNASGGVERRVFAIDVVARTITPQASLPLAVSDGSVVSDGETAWLVGGWRGQPLTQVLKATLA